MKKVVCLLFLLLPMGFHLLSYAQAGDETERAIKITAVAGLKYDVTRIQVKPSELIRLTLSNADEMDHNLVITKPGARLEVVDAANKLGEKGPKQSYIPDSGDVLWSVPVVRPGQAAQVVFRVPARQGIYPYVCTFPGHGLVMYGAMYVTTKKLPPLEEDPNVPHVDADVHGGSHHEAGVDLHPYKTTPPCLYRIFMPDAGPAAIAVSLPNGLSYCWDAGACRLRYAWEGGFLDPKDYFDKKAEKHAKIVGTIFYRDKTTYPLRFSPDKVPVVDFRGYTLIDRYPEFHYTVDGNDVYELIKPNEGGNGLIRSFRIPEAARPLYFVFDSSDGVEYTASKGTVRGAGIMLSRDDAHGFVIVMTKRNAAP